MRVNWVSPLPPSRTDIAHYTIRLLPALSRLAEVRLWTEQAGWDADLVRPFPVSRLVPGETPWTMLQDADVTFYNIGNNSDFHFHTWEVSRAMPGIVILHDRCLQHLFAGHYLGLACDAKEWLGHMERHYHGEGYRAALSYLNQECSTDELAAEYPLTPLAVEDALGVLVHTKAGYGSIGSALRCPVAYGPLPYPATRGPELERWQRVRKSSPSGPPFRIALCGYLGPNRRIEPIISALAGMPEREQFRLDIYGTLWDQRALEGWIRNGGLSGRVHFHGFVADLDSALAGADLALNLRYPSMGEASGTQLRIWDHGLPSLVTRTGWYASLPADTVLFVRLEHEIDDIRTHLRGFLEDRAKFLQIGANGRHLLETVHAPEQYASTLLALAAQARDFQPRLAALRLADRVGYELGRWAGPAAGSAADSVAHTIKKMCAGS